MNSIELSEHIKEYLTLKETLRVKTEIVDTHYSKLENFWRVEDSLNSFSRSWIKINLKSTETEKPYIKIMFNGRYIEISIRGMNIIKSELDNTRCSGTVKAAEYLLTYRADEFMLKLQDRIRREKVRLFNKKNKNLNYKTNENLVYALEIFYSKFVSLRSCILDNPNKIQMGKLVIS